MSNSQTVQDWIEKLPSLGDTTPLANSTLPAMPCASWAQLFEHLGNHSRDGITSKRYWRGAYLYMRGGAFPENSFVAVRAGYSWAKKVFGAQKVGMLSDEEQRQFIESLSQSRRMVVRFQDTESQEVLKRKAELLEELKELLQDFSSKLQDIVNKL